MILQRSLTVLAFLLTALLSHQSVLQAADKVTLEAQPSKVIVKINGEEFTVFHYDASLPKPYFWPVRGADGTVITRPIEPGEKEHPHHRGMWLSVDEVNDIKFWAEKGKIVNKDVAIKSGDVGTIKVHNDWVGRDGKPVLIEKTTITIHPNRLVTYDTTIGPPPGQLARFDDTKEGFFGIRIPHSMREKEGGTVVNADGQRTTAQCWGRPSKWVDYYGQVEGKTYGVAIMDHPANFRPSRYHVRDYGLFSISPFGEGSYQNDASKAKPVILDDQTPSLRIRYGLFVHNGPTEEAKVPDAYNQFLESTK